MPGSPMSRSTNSGRKRGELDGREAVVGDPDVVAEELEEPAHAARRIHVVVDDEDSGSAPLRDRRRIGRSIRRPPRRRQVDR